MSGTTFTLTVPGAPVAKGRPRFTKQGGAYTPAATRQAEWEIRAAWVAKYPDMAPLQGPLFLEVDFALPQPKGIPLYRRHTASPSKKPDLDNLLKAVTDGLNKVAFVDDAQVVQVVLRKRYAVGSTPNTFILLGEVTP